jgi:ribonuclease D
LREIFSNAGRSGTLAEVIDTDVKLAALLPVIQKAPWLALDTEADSLHAYPEKVCLIQISTVAGDELVDPLAPINLDPLFAAFNAHEMIFHAADYDLRLLRKHHEFTPLAIFDTMLAARLLGEPQFGLSNLVEKFLGVKLDKGSQKADWARRPLTEKMEVYARNDTHYLKPLADKLKAELIAKKRLASSWTRKPSGASKAVPILTAPNSPFSANSGTGAKKRPLPPTVRLFLFCRTRPWSGSPWRWPRNNPWIRWCRPACTRAAAMP